MPRLTTEEQLMTEKQLIYKWIEKASKSKCLSVFLIPARTDTKWFHEFIYEKDNVTYEFLKGRVKFDGGGKQCTIPQYDSDI